ncbi:hypothetical protein FOY91_17115 [Sphingomonas solaris]|uniref:SPOR domain-containing protein n=2 Tax=Alterirhizorhabdus solaris TaxID=2529389 RepID=A0A558QW03_9SPHN|nr:hypothetical protein FOY91_17115 [Sphingomonas solaris]
MRGAGMLALLAAGAMVPAMAAAAPTKRRPTTPPTEDMSVKQGADAWEAGNYARALAIWRPLADAGNADAQYNMAQSYRLGRGVAVDEAQARSWDLKAAQQDHPEAQANYGLLLFQGNERNAALPWLSKASARGDARAQYVLGTALFNGNLFGKDWVRAYALMTRAAAAGLPQAVTSLAEMDRYVPLQQRQQGTALARDMERSAVLADASSTTPSSRLVKARTQVAARGEAGPAPAVRPMRPAPAVATAATPAVVSVPVAASRSAPVPGAASYARPAAVRATAPTPAGPVSAGSGGWRVQVGAFADPATAGSVWAGISAKVPGLALRSYMVKSGAVTRLQAGPLASRVDATRMCARITAATGNGCFPVATP